MAPLAIVEMPLLALAVAEEEYLLAEAEIPEFTPEAEIESISEINSPAERELTPVYRLSVADLQSEPWQEEYQPLDVLQLHPI